jgi:hypothetical protein
VFTNDKGTYFNLSYGGTLMNRDAPVKSGETEEALMKRIKDTLAKKN